MPFTRNELEHFICTPSQNIETMVLLDAIQCVSAYLEQAPEVITDIISNHPYIPASCLLEDLAEKIALAQAHSDASQLDSLNALYEFADFQDKLFSADTNGYIL